LDETGVGLLDFDDLFEGEFLLRFFKLFSLLFFSLSKSSSHVSCSRDLLRE
jgi:hypothetical protein